MFAKVANQRDLTPFSKQGFIAFFPATFSRWVPTPNWRTTAGRNRLTSLTQTTRSCRSSSGWLSMTENMWLSLTDTQLWSLLPRLFCREGQKRPHPVQHPDFVSCLSSWGKASWMCGERRADGACWLPPRLEWKFAGGGWPLISSSIDLSCKSYRSFYTAVNWMNYLIWRCWVYLACRWDQKGFWMLWNLKLLSLLAPLWQLKLEKPCIVLQGFLWYGFVLMKQCWLPVDQKFLYSIIYL